MALRNPFERLSFGGYLKPKPLQFPNRGMSDNETFNPQQMGRPTTQPIESRQAPEKRQPSSEWDNYLSEMSDIYTKEGAAAGAYREHMNAVPEYQTPSRWSKVGAALVGGAEGYAHGAGAGWNAAQNVHQAPYRRAMEQWGVKEQALGRNAEIEDKSSNRRLQFMKETREVAQDEQELSKWMRDYDLKVTQEENDEAHREAEREEWETRGYRTRFDDKGNEVAYHPGRPGSEHILGSSSKKTDWAYDDKRLAQGAEGNRIARDRLGIADRTEQRMNRREDRYENPPISASEQSAARDSALNRASLERRDWAEFVTPEGGANAPQDPDKRAKFREFMRRVEAIEKGIFSQRRSLGKEEPEFDYEY